jgi:hypothetical protein
MATRCCRSAAAIAGRKSSAAQAFISSRDVLWNVAPETSTTRVLWLEITVPPLPAAPGVGWDAWGEQLIPDALIIAEWLHD